MISTICFDSATLLCRGRSNRRRGGKGGEGDHGRQTDGRVRVRREAVGDGESVPNRISPCAPFPQAVDHRSSPNVSPTPRKHPRPMGSQKDPTDPHDAHPTASLVLSTSSTSTFQPDARSSHLDVKLHAIQRCIKPVFVWPSRRCPSVPRSLVLLAARPRQRLHRHRHRHRS